MEAIEIVEVLTELEEKSDIENCFVVMLDKTTDLVKHYSIQDVGMSMMCDEIQIAVEEMDIDDFVTYDIGELKEKLIKFQMEYPLVPIVCSCGNFDKEVPIETIACLMYKEEDITAVGIVIARDEYEMIDMLRILNPGGCDCSDQAECSCDCYNNEPVGLSCNCGDIKGDEGCAGVDTDE